MTGPADRPDDLPYDVIGAPPLDLSAALNQMSGLVLSRETVETALELVTSLAATTTTTGTMGAAVTVVDEHGKRSGAASHQAVEQADSLQDELDEGPCLAAWRTRELVRIDDTTTDGRWPRWNDAVHSLGVRSVHSTPLVIGGATAQPPADRGAGQPGHDRPGRRRAAGSGCSQRAVRPASVAALRGHRREQ